MSVPGASRKSAAPPPEAASVLAGLDPDLSLDDLEPLRELIGTSRVVAIGEGCHFVTEFADARRRLIRFLTERCGFTVLAWEFGVVEGRLLDDVLRKGDDVGRLSGLPGTTSSGLDPAMARWLWEHNRSSGAPVDFLGIDTPMAGGSLDPLLAPLEDYLSEVDPEMLGTVRRVREVAAGISGGSVAVAAQRWSSLSQADKDALTAGLSRLSTRMRALAPAYLERADAPSYDLAVQHLDAAQHTDYMFSALAGVLSGDAPVGDASVRDHFMARTMADAVAAAPAATRFVVVAHNQHVQKVPVSYDGSLAAYPMGHYLATRLGEDYRAIALTHTADSVPEMFPDDNPEVGFSLVDTPVSAPSEHSFERWLGDAGLADEATLTDLAGFRESSLHALRTQSTEIELPLAEAFDGVLSVPTVTTGFSTRL